VIETRFNYRYNRPMITAAFPYTTLTRAEVNGQRLYSCPENQYLPSVTTILDATKSQKDKEALENWRKWVGPQKAVAITREAASRGTRQGKFLENWINTDDMGYCGTHPMAKIAHNMASTIIEKGLVNCTKFYGTEIGLWYPSLYAGSTDCIAEIDGEIVIIDFKQSNKLKKEEYLDSYRNQLVAYAIAHNHLYGTNITSAVNMICTPDLEYQEFWIRDTEFKRFEEMWWEKVIKFHESQESCG